MRIDGHGRPYYVDHNTRTTTWEKPTPLPSGSVLRSHLPSVLLPHIQTLTLRFRGAQLGEAGGLARARVLCGPQHADHHVAEAQPGHDEQHSAVAHVVAEPHGSVGAAHQPLPLPADGTADRGQRPLGASA